MFITAGIVATLSLVIFFSEPEEDKTKADTKSTQVVKKDQEQVESAKIEKEKEVKELAEKKEMEEAAAKAKQEAEAKEKAEAEAKTGEESKAKAEAESKAKEEARIAELGLEAVTVGRVVDGDTIVTTDGRKVRLIGVNTPESTTRNETYGKEASNYTKSKLSGKKIWMQRDVSETDRYGRYLRIIWLAIPANDMNENEIRAKMFNAHLVLNGYAEPSTYPPDVKYSDFFVKFAREAREAGTGLWAYGTEGTTKGDLDSQRTANTTSRQSTSGSKSGATPSKPASTAPATNNQTEIFANCTELRTKYPNGVPADHPAYQPKMDRDKDNYACER
ncbi:thermonuclease family protein [Bacillus sp. REN3]|uniref:thermonuclease family protein n=1 Tax=Bacillus sp. REN3 TaxID=2802440 RepID=UPI001FEDD0E4|nr:thermonuclease family protein [Bacillus sp. REN3]